MKNYLFPIILMMIFSSCHTETGGSYDFMSDQIGVVGFLIKNWWILVIVIAIFIIIGLTEKKKDN
jgi:hypothetical protein